MSSNYLRIGLAALAMLVVAGCNSAQRDSAMRSVRSLQQSGTAQAATPPDAPEQAPPPGGAPPGGPGKPGGKTPDSKTPEAPDAKAPAAPGSAAGAEAGKDAKTSSPEEIIDKFLKSDPRDILEEKSDRLQEKQTKPWEQDNPETFIPETGRKDPMTAVRSSIPKELLPKRSGDEDENELQSYLLTQAATQIMLGITKNVRCYSVIQIGLTKYVRISLDPQGKQIRTLSLSNGFSQRIATEEGALQIDFSVSSISSDEVVIDVAVSGLSTQVSVQKQLVFIPRNMS
jgi:hypothetical protein